MRRVFLVFGIAAFSSASAQQKDLFDIEEHLKKKSLENNTQAPAMGNPFSNPDMLNSLKVGQLPGLPNEWFSVPGTGGMPNVQVDIKQFTTMPNPGLGLLSLYQQQGALIPNVADKPKSVTPK